MRLLIRLLFLLLCAALVASAWLTYTSVTTSTIRHDIYYTQVHPWLHDIRQWTLFGVLAASLLLVRRDPNLVRVGLLSVIASLAIMLIPPRQIHQAVTKVTDLKFDLGKH